MFSRSSKGLIVYLVAFLAALLVVSTPSLWAQHGSTGTVVITVVDQSGAVVVGADLELRDLATNAVRNAQTQGAGLYTFIDLPNGTYRLSVSKTGYTKQVFDTVVVQAAQSTGVNVTLKVGAVSEVVEVTESATPLVEATSNAVGTVIDLKQIEDLPLSGRDLTALANLVPGNVSTNTPNGYAVTWEGLPQIAQGANVDGVAAGTSRMKFAGLPENVSPRLESIQEMTVQTDQLDVDQGFGQSNMQINYVTRRGSNALHGRIFEDFRNRTLNANSWFNDAQGVTKPPLILNEFGGSVGGPIIKDKLFYFGSFSIRKQPGIATLYGGALSTSILSASAIAGNFQYTGTSGPETVNVLQLVQGNTTLNGPVQQALASITSSAIPAGFGVANASDANLETLSWNAPTKDTWYFPTVRLDYNLSAKYHLAFAFNETKETNPNQYSAPLPGKLYANQTSGFRQNNYSSSLTFDWMPNSALENEFRGGFLYNYLAYNFNYDNSLLPLGVLNFPLGVSGINQQPATGQYYPLFSASDTVNWQHGAHTVKFGFSFFREQDHYYNSIAGYPIINLGLNSFDPAATPLTNPNNFPGANGSQIAEAGNLYATLAGHISNINGLFAENPSSHAYPPKLGDYNLDELYNAWGLYFQDSYRLRSNLTLNYGLRWDFTGADHDLTGGYHTVLPDSIFGPSGVWNLFNPGSLTGNQNPSWGSGANAYHGWHKSPQPAIGLIWDPRKDGKTVIRSGFSLRRYTEPQQYFWNAASGAGAYFFQTFALNPSNQTGAGFFTPGSLVVGDGLPQSGGSQPVNPALSWSGCPQTYGQTAMSDFTFASCTLGYLGYPTGIDPNIRQPYSLSWNLGIQREISRNNVLEIRYVGTRNEHQWLPLNINEVNVFQSGQYGVLTNFKAAQQNLVANNASGNANYAGSFANHGLAGQQATPLFDAAFAGEGAGADGSLSDYTFAPFVLYLQQGQVGQIGQALTNNNGNAPYFCNLVGQSFGPCANNIGYTGAGAGVPSNFLQANPYSAGTPIYFTSDKGYSTYHALQVDFRQKQWHGMQFDANYTWSHNLGTNGINDWLGYGNQFSVRDIHLGYGPGIDLRHVLHVNGTYDLPFGKGKALANQGGVLDKIVGGWTLGTILNYQSGAPFLLTGGYNTFNNYGDGGIVLSGVTAAQLQSSIGVHHVPGQPLVDIIGPKYLASTTGGAIPTQIAPNTTPGTFGNILYLHGPRYFQDDLSITKAVAIREKLRFNLQGEFLNVFNHPAFGIPDRGVQDPGFGVTSGTVGFGARQIELRANIEF